jgi:hypothetical protein
MARIVACEKARVGVETGVEERRGGGEGLHEKGFGRSVGAVVHGG